MAQTAEIRSLMEIFQDMKHKAGRLMEPLTQAEGLTSLQCCVLLQVSQGDASVGSISERTGMGQANTSTLCKKLEQAGYLTRKRNPRDERMVMLALTEQGKQTLERTQQRLKEFEQMLESMPEQVMEDLLRGLAAVNLVLDHMNEQVKGV